MSLLESDKGLLADLESLVVPALLADKPAGETLRVWVPGCATGEIAYAIASVLHAQALKRVDPPDIQLFATDSDADAIMIARRGQYSETLALALPPESLRYFFQHGKDYHVSTTVRGLTMFARHRLLDDPPFARLDLIVCRSRLGALALGVQEQLLHMFHWSLRRQGYLALGEELDGAQQPDLFVQHPGAPQFFQRRNRRGVAPPALRHQAHTDEQPIDETLRVVNEYLQDLNQALRRKVRELSHANNDLNNLMSATDLATIFLDRALQVSRFTAQAQELFNLIPGDRGRPLAHITHMLDYDELIDDAAGVLASLQSIEREVRGVNGHWYLVRMRPYRTADAQIDGVVLVCVDITARRAMEAELRRARDELELRVTERTHELSATNTRLEVEIAERTRLEHERSELLRRLVMTQEDERRRIARELHDQLGQSVSALGVGLGLLAEPTLGAAQQQQIMARLRRITAQIDRDMRQLAIELRPTVLDDLGLIEAVQHHVERWAEQTGIAAEFQATGLEAGRLPYELESVTYRVIQEALTNVSKHAQAQGVSVILERLYDQVRVIVEDDGRGFDLDAVQQGPDVQQRLGLLGMRERVTLVGGTVIIETEPGAGTTLFAQIPLPA